MAERSVDPQKERQRVRDLEERARKAEQRAREAERRERHRALVAERTIEAQRKTAALEHRIDQLDSILADGLRWPAKVEFERLRRSVDVAELQLGDLATPIAAKPWESIEPPRPGPVARMLGGQRRYEREWAARKADYDQYVAGCRDRERARQEQVAQRERDHAAAVEQAENDVARHNAGVEALEDGVRRRDSQSVQDYLARALREVPLPRAFPRRVDVIVDPGATEAVLQMELPPRSVVPLVKAYTVNQRTAEEKPQDRPRKDVADQYRQVISQVVLLAIRCLFGSDAHIWTVSVNGHISAIDPAIGAQVYPCLVTVKVAREDFLRDENLRAVEPHRCLQRLGALVSQHPFEHEPIEPLLDFDLTKFSFVKGFDAVATLDSRPNLLDMSYTRFEHLVRQIFEAQGAEGWTTTPSKDNGVDAVITKRTSLMGGLSIVQAKRYKPSHVLGPSHLRELAGAMEEKKAGWGILITTSRFSAGCDVKAREHGRMELIDGNRLIWLIKQHLGKDVLIG